MVTERLGFGQTGYPSRAATSQAHVRITLEIVQTQAVDVGAAKTRSAGEGRRYVSWGRHLSTVARGAHCAAYQFRSQVPRYGYIPHRGHWQRVRDAGPLIR
jgi:hypothetical protein